MNDIDFERAAMLMGVMEKQVSISPMMTSIFGEASAELKEINRLAKENADERAEKIRAEEQVAQQKVLETQKADREREERDGANRQQPLTNNPLPPSITPGQPTEIPLTEAQKNGNVERKL